MNRAKLLLLVLVAAMAFGGTFECRGSSGHRHDDDDDGDVRIRAAR